MKVHIEYAGGTGGETLGWAIRCGMQGFYEPRKSHLSQDFDRSATRSRLNDIMLAMRTPTVGPPEMLRTDILADYTDRPWLDVPYEVFKRYVDHVYAVSPPPHLSVSHTHFQPFEHWRDALTDATIIEMNASLSFRWLPKLMLIPKTFFSKHHELPHTPDHWQYGEAKAFFDRHGWIPRFWSWQLGWRKNLHDTWYLDWWKNDPRDEVFFTGRTSRYKPGDFCVDPRPLLIDPSLSEFRYIFDRLALTLSPEVAHDLQIWVMGNRNLIHQFGLWDYVHRDDLTYQDQGPLMHTGFKRFYAANILRQNPWADYR